MTESWYADKPENGSVFRHVVKFLIKTEISHQFQF